jgi:hypothetical protein
MSTKIKERQIWAILVGIDYYIPGTARRDGQRLIIYNSLSGCVQDVKTLETVLIQRHRVPHDHIWTLISSAPINRDTNSPREPPALWPTYENLKRTLQDVTAIAKPGDIVYFHHSGHGARVKTVYPKYKSNGLDEALAPVDMNCGG